MHARPPAATRRRHVRRPAARSRGRASARRRHADARRRSRALVAAIAVPLIVIAVGLLLVTAIAVGTVRDLFAGARDNDPLFAAPVEPAEPQISGYGLDQLAHACTIMVAGRDLGVDVRDQTIAVMTAMGESSLRNLDYGDWETSGVTNPDGSPTTSVGLFQQQDHWGSREARLDPYTAATLFYRAMADRVPDRHALEPTLVAHYTQVNADPFHYARYWGAAERVVAALNAAPLRGDSVDGIPLCTVG